MSKPEWMIAQVMRYLGVPGLSGLALIVLAAVMLVGFVLPSEEKLQRITSQVADLQASRNIERAHPGGRAHPAESGLTEFYKLLPPEQGATKLLDKIYQSASKESLRLTQGEYRFTPGKEGHFGDYQIILPVKGSYIQVRKFIADVLNELPTAALDGVSFKRETIGSTDLETRIQFTVYLGIV